MNILLFREAVAAVDAGDLVVLNGLLSADPALAGERLTEAWPELREQIGGALDGFFRDPYLLWFVTEDPVRTGRMPENVVEITRAILDAAKGSPGFQEQIDYGLRLVAWSRVAWEQGAQIDLIDLLCEFGASTDGVANDALVNGHIEAVRRLSDQGKLTLEAAVCLGRFDEAACLPSTADQKQSALVLAALNGIANGVEWMLDHGADPSRPSPHIYSHGTPLHHAVCSGSMDAVRLLVERGADTQARDLAYGGTPLGWAHHSMQGDSPQRFREIAAFLESL